MKKTIYYILSVLCVFLVSCENFLTEDPQSNLSKKNFWKNQQDANVGIIAIYSEFATAMSGGLWDWGEVRGDNWEPYERGAKEQVELVRNTIQIDNSTALWTNIFNVISKANSALKYIPDISMSATLKNHYLAEAYALRAWAYFYCIRVWGDVPLFTEPIEEYSTDIYRPRTSKDVIMRDIILPDLEKAYSMINQSETTRYRLNVATLCALTMDVYAWLNDYEAVIRIMEERVSSLPTSEYDLIDLNAGNFVNGWRAMFIEDNTVDIPKEVLMKLQYDRYGNGVNKAVGYFGGGSCKISLTSKVVNELYESTDLRKGAAQWVSRKTSGYTRHLFERKFWPDDAKFTGSDKEISENDIVIYRYADIVLLYAEALNAMDRKADALAQLNKTRMRAGNPPFMAQDFIDKEELLDAILDERQKEFLGEGKRWFDLVRTDRWRKVMYPINGMNDRNDILFPIHRNHLIQNYKLVQNPGYPTP